MRSIVLGILCTSLTCSTAYCDVESEEPTEHVEKAPEKDSTPPKQGKTKTVALICGVFIVGIVTAILASHYKGDGK